MLKLIPSMFPLTWYQGTAKVNIFKKKKILNFQFWTKKMQIFYPKHSNTNDQEEWKQLHLSINAKILKNMKILEPVKILENRKIRKFTHQIVLTFLLNRDKGLSELVGQVRWGSYSMGSCHILFYWARRKKFFVFLRQCIFISL